MPSAAFPRVGRSGHRSLLLAAAFAAGSVLPRSPVRDWPVALGALLLLALVLARQFRETGNLLPRAVVPLLLGAAVSATHLGCDPSPHLLAVWKEHDVQPGVTPIGLQGRLLDIESLPEGRAALVIRLSRFIVPGDPPFQDRVRGPILARVTVPLPDNPSDLTLRPGQFLELTARIGWPRNFQNPGAFDYAAYLKAAGIDLVGSVKSWRLIRIVPGGRRGLCGIFPEARRHIVSALVRSAGKGNEGTASFVSALLVGERQELSADLEDKLVRAGVFHIVALSGFNVALVAALIAAQLKAIRLHPAARRVLLAVSIITYWAIARSSGSMARATVMALLYLGGGVLRRRVSGVGAMSSASVLLLLANPFWVQDPGFQLSLAATLGILVLAPGERGWTERSGDAGAGGARDIQVGASWRFMRGSLRVSAAALAGTSLITARHFQTVTPIALVANLFAVPLAGVLLVLGAFAAALECWASGFATALLAVCRILIRLLEEMCERLAGVPGGSLYVIPPGRGVVLGGLVAVVAVGAGGRRLRRVACAVFLLLIVGTLLAGRFDRPRGRLEVVLLDVGQGDAILVRFPEGTTLLVDTGGFARSQFDVGARVVAPALRALGVLKLDLLAITHAHRDHIGGARSVFTQFSPEAIWLGRMPPRDPSVEELQRLAARREVPVVSPRRGVRLRIDSTVVEILNPGRGVGLTGPATNNDSLVLRLTYRDRSILLTGDLEDALESALVQEGRVLAADVLKVGHHGSRTSTSPSFLERIHPSLGLISVGAGNPWGHPSAEILARLSAAQVSVFTTERDGAIRVFTDGASGWKVERLTGESAQKTIRTRPDSGE